MTAALNPSWSAFLLSQLQPDLPVDEATAKSREFLQALRDHQQLLYQIIRTQAPDPEDWRDLEQEIILQLWRSFPKYDPTYKLSTWIYRIAFNVTITQYRKKKSRKRHEVIRPNEAFFQRADEAESGSLEAERRALLYQTIRLLPLADRSLLLLHLDGHSYAEISDILGISPSNVGTRLNRIRKRLAKLITQPKNL